MARIDRLEREYWSAWEASKKEQQTSTTEQTTDADGERLKAAIRKTEKTGDPRYLAGVERCIEQRAKILGLHAPTETRLTGRDGGPVRFSLEEAVAADRELAEAEGACVQRCGGPALPDGSPQVP